jgi:NADP-reducing hydrogenase subunit HndB
MAKLTLDELRKMREEQKNAVQKRSTEGKEITIIVGMGTCGIAAGAKDTVDSFLKEIDSKGLTDVIVKQTGCMGFCVSEPTVEVHVPGMPDTIYGNVDRAVAKRIVEEHLVGKKMVSDHVFDKPSIDIIKN